MTKLNSYSEKDLIRAENEALLKGQPSVVSVLDDHHCHIREHVNSIRSNRANESLSLFDRVLIKLKLKRNPVNNREAFNKTMDHIQEHIDLIKTTDKTILDITCK